MREMYDISSENAVTFEQDRMYVHARLRLPWIPFYSVNGNIVMTNQFQKNGAGWTQRDLIMSLVNGGLRPEGVTSFQYWGGSVVTQTSVEAEAFGNYLRENGFKPDSE